MAKVPTAQGKRTDIQPADSVVGKYETIREAGFTPKQVERFKTKKRADANHHESTRPGALKLPAKYFKAPSL